MRYLAVIADSRYLIEFSSIKYSAAYRVFSKFSTIERVQSFVFSISDGLKIPIKTHMTLFLKKLRFLDVVIFCLTKAEKEIIIFVAMIVTADILGN
ncbi:MAG: hypothetical protein LBL99_02915 [Holosporaceae bacterium]|jgi:hypothetical protein|nr:hypothetical protein [Holosporaceae bacterium]